MNFKEILELIDKVAASGISSVEVEQAGSKVRVEGKKEAPAVIASYAAHEMKPSAPSAPAAPPPSPEVVAAAKAAADKTREDEIEAGMHIITSPIVGTFYRSPNPESEAFVSVGDKITKGKVLCIVEAMKLMNEIESDIEGVITKVYPSNGQPVEYGEKLFAVKV